MSEAKANIAWIDAETDGLSYFRGGHLLEIACVVTDADLNILDADHPFHAVFKYSTEEVGIMAQNAREVVREMHANTGLWGLLSGPGAAPREWIDNDLTKYLAMFGAPGAMPVGGNSVRLDLNFIEDSLPTTYGYLDYQMRDMTSVGKLAQAWTGIAPFKKVGSHTAMGDILESIAEARYYRDHAFKTVSETFVTDDGAFESWLAEGRANGWTSEPSCVSHDGYPITPEEQEEDDPCVHVLRLYPDLETKQKAEADL